MGAQTDARAEGFKIRYESWEVGHGCRGASGAGFADALMLFARGPR